MPYDSLYEPRCYHDLVSVVMYPCGKNIMSVNLGVPNNIHHGSDASSYDPLQALDGPYVEHESIPDNWRGSLP